MGEYIRGLWCHPHGGAELDTASGVQRELAIRFESPHRTAWVARVGYDWVLFDPDAGRAGRIPRSQVDGLIAAHTPEQTATTHRSETPSELRELYD